ncbi:major facilitator superfamily domain-containing protein [Dactylonectria macrodidyma]|uniref:Major facilitator superfamily domain-containing protein n=1 Tax=Dactylonectria macrodidyma TaxID=307937 RepID=A0A9P9DJG0_9HYPO|nr:major facilitator superfamily domain-containing protein [Dactylonectria macrodidyma]
MATARPSLWAAGALDVPDSNNPVKFSLRKKRLVVAVGVATIINSGLGSSLPSGATSAIAKDLNVTNPTLLVLLNSIYLVGFAIGPLLFGPLSEHVGRRPVLIGTYLGYTISTMCCAVSPTFGVLLLFRLLCGIAAGAPNAVVGPLYADVYDDPAPRGRAMAYFMCSTSMTPPFGPIISGYASKISWRLSFWIGLGIAVVCLPVILVVPETYVPVIKRRLMKDGEARGSEAGVLAQGNKTRLLDELKVVFSRPFKMIFQEPLVLFTSLYLALIYATLYLFFQAYPIIFQGVYGLSPGEVGLTLLPVAAGSVIALCLFLWYSSHHAKALKAGSAWAISDEYRRLPLACAGGPLVVASLFWLGWTSYPSIHPAVPALSGLLFGTGYLIIFMAMLNYLGDAYKQFSASAQAAASTTRSIVAVCLPLAAAPMYGNLGIQWACSLLAFLTLIMALIPFVFIKFGPSIRQRSPFCQQVLQLTQITPIALDA